MDNYLKRKVTAIRKTSESSVSVTIEKGELKADYRKHIVTPIAFLNHMIEHIAWRAGLNIDISLDMPDFQLIHLVCEDASVNSSESTAPRVMALQRELSMKQRRTR